MSSRRQQYNRAIRAECPGGAELLDLLTLVESIRTRHDDPEVVDVLGAVVTRLHDVRDAMVNSIQQSGMGN